MNTMLKDAFEEAIKKRSDKTKKPDVVIEISTSKNDEDKPNGLAPSKLKPEVPEAKAKEEAMEAMTPNPIDETDPNTKMPMQEGDKELHAMLEQRAMEGGAPSREPRSLGERAAAAFMKKKMHG